VTDRQVQEDLTSELADPKIKQDVTAQYGDDLSQIRRQLLNQRVLHELVTEATERTGVAIQESEVTKLIDADGGFQQISESTHLSRDLIVRRYRDLLLMAELGYTKQGVARPTEASLREAYEKAAPQQATMQLGLIPVRDLATLDKVYNQVKADPAQFDEVAKQYPGASPESSDYPKQRLAPIITQAKAGDIVRYVGVGADAGSFYVIKVYGTKTPTFEEMRTSLTLPSLSNALQAGVAYIGQFSQQVGVRVSPRYGSWDPKKAQISDTQNPVVTLHTAEPSSTAVTGAPANS